MKREINNFKVLKNDKQFKTWHTSLIATAAYQDVSEVLDSSYVPQTQEEKELFKEKQKYMYAVAVIILQTDIGIEQVGTHEKILDAQKVFSSVLNHYLKSRTADIDSSDVLTYITSAKLDDGRWNGKPVGFLTH